MKEENVKDAIYWNIVKALGYPANVEGIVLGSQEHRTLLDLERLLELGKLVHEGYRIGWAAGISYSKLIRRYWDVYYGFLLVYGGEEATIESIISDLRREAEEIINMCEEVIKATRYIRQWIREGGVVKRESLKHLWGDVVIFGEYEDIEWDPLKDVGERIKESFGDDKLNRIISVLKIGNADERIIEAIKKIFVKEKSKVMKSYEKASIMMDKVLSMIEE